METVEVLVQMSKEDYMFIKTMVENGYETPSSYYYNIASGIVLPKGHGDLKDISNLKYVFDLTREDPIYSGKDIERAVKTMKSIIEADKAESGEIKQVLAYTDQDTMMPAT